MPENNQYRNNHSRQPMHDQLGGQYRQGQPNMQGRPDRQAQRRPAPNKQGVRKSRRQLEKEAQMASAVKGIIAIMITFLIVIIVIMLFWKNLFPDNAKGDVATGTITSTEYIAPETKTATENVNSKKSSKKKTSKKEEEEEYEDENTQKITCTGAVILHPEPSSSSAQIDVIPGGVEVTFIRNENNWFYVDYNGQKGYAWGNYFTAPVGVN